MKALHFALLFPLLACLVVSLMAVGCERETRVYDRVNSPRSVSYFEWEGHNYMTIYFHQHLSGVVHNPDCPCLKNGNSKVEK